MKRANRSVDFQGGTLALVLLALAAGGCATAQPGPVRSAAIPAADEGAMQSADESPEYDAANDGESGEEVGDATADGLRQLLAEAEAVLSGGAAASAGLRDAVSRAMSGLQSALERQAAQLEGGDPAGAAAAAADVARAGEALRSALAAIQDGGGLEGTAPDGGTSDGDGYGGESYDGGPAPGFLQKVTGVLDASLQIIERIQALRAAVRGFRDDQGAPGPGILSDSEGSELEEVAGVVTEDGRPVAGARVRMPGLDRETTTASDGSYTLTGVPRRPTSLQVIRGGRTVAEGQVAVLAGRPGVADFDLSRATGARTRRGASVLPSQVAVRGGSGPRGTVRGTVEDASGRPVPLASVRMPGLALARTDTAGRFVFRGVPAGERTIVVSRPGAADATERVDVHDRQVSEPRIRMAMALSRGGRQDVSRKTTTGRETHDDSRRNEAKRQQATRRGAASRPTDPRHVSTGAKVSERRETERERKKTVQPEQKPKPRLTPSPTPARTRPRKPPAPDRPKEPASPRGRE